MASDAAVVGLRFRGNDIQILDGLWLEITRGLDEIPEIRGSDTIVPGRPGRIRRNRVADRWSIELTGWVRGVGSGEAGDQTAYRTNVRAMQAIFDPTLPTGDLVAYLEDGSFQVIEASVVPPMLVDKRTPAFAAVSIELESVDAGWVIGGS